ncbi:MAG: tetratricopeptide repeat protein [Gammaproteobacteria bacterium]
MRPNNLIQNIQLFLALSMQALLVCCNSALAVVPQKVINEVYPLDQTIASFSKVINAGRVQGTALAEIYRERGIHYADLGHYDKAVADFTNAVELNPNYVTAYINRANAFAKLEQYKAAYQDFAIAQKLSPTNKSIYAIRGSLNFLMGRGRGGGILPVRPIRMPVSLAISRNTPNKLIWMYGLVHSSNCIWGK